jgi:hypothetical protein
MHAFIRRYRIGAGSIEELVAQVESQFPSQSPHGAGALPDGIAGFHAIDTGDRTITTIALFEAGQDRAQVESRAREIQANLSEFKLEELDALTGEVVLARASDRLVDAIRK